jgi:hypothetical protein
MTLKNSKLQFELLRQNLIIFYSCILSVCQYIQESMYFPQCIRTMYTDATRGGEFTTQLLHGHPGRIQNFTRLKRDTFLALLDWLLTHTDLGDSREATAAEKLIIFLFIGAKFRIAAETLQHSTEQFIAPSTKFSTAYSAYTRRSSFSRPIEHPMKSSKMTNTGRTFLVVSVLWMERISRPGSNLVTTPDGGIEKASCHRMF